MRAFATMLTMAVLAVPLTAAGQQQEQSNTTQNVLKMPPPVWNLTQEDKQAYCFWGGELFSLGASFCSRQQSSMTCTEWPGKRPIWVVKDNDKACDRNPSLTPL